MTSASLTHLPSYGLKAETKADAWLQMALERGIAPDDEAIRQIIQERNSPLAGMAVDTVRWPEEPLRSAMIRAPSELVSQRLNIHRHSALLQLHIASLPSVQHRM